MSDFRQMGFMWKCLKCHEVFKTGKKLSTHLLLEHEAEKKE